MQTENPTKAARTPASNTGGGSSTHEHTPLLVGYAEAARLLGVSRRHIETLAAAGILRKIDVRTPGSRRATIRFRYEDLLHCIDEMANGGGRR